MAPRFGTHTPDSAAYLTMVEIFRGLLGGETPAAAWPIPFAYRPLVPLLAAVVPGARPDLTVAALNVALMLGALHPFAHVARRLCPDDRTVDVALLLFIGCFSTFYNAPVVLTDTAGFFATTLGVRFILEERWAPLLVVVAVGVLAKETAILLVPIAGTAALVTRVRAPSTWAWLAAIALVPLIETYLVRAAIGREPYVWAPSLRWLLGNLRRTKALTAIAAVVLPPLLFAVYALLRGGRARLARLPRWDAAVSYAALGWVTALLAYSFFSAAASERFFWPAYVAVAPLTAIALEGTALDARVLGPAARVLFGAGPAAPGVSDPR